MDLDLNDLAKVSRLFEALDARGRKELLGLSHRVKFRKGDVICREGDPGREFFVITSGSVGVLGQYPAAREALHRVGVLRMQKLME
jgi:CRP-like cAMP-binding protein